MLAESFGTEEPAVAAPENGDAAKARAINQQLAAAKAYLDAGDWDHARAAAKAATEIDPNRDLPWAWLANIDCEQASHTTDIRGFPAERLHSALQVCDCDRAQTPRITTILERRTRRSRIGSRLPTISAPRHNSVSAHASLYHQNLGAALLNQAESLPAKDGLATVAARIS